MLGYRIYPDEVSVQLFQYIQDEGTGADDDPFLVAIIQPDVPNHNRINKYLVFQLY